jgi:hypothetical protein
MLALSQTGSATGEYKNESASPALTEPALIEGLRNCQNFGTAIGFAETISSSYHV